MRGDLKSLLAILFGVLLTLPLAWLSYAVLHGSRRPQPSPTLPLIPMLSREESLRLQTYQRNCETDADCEPPLACFFNVVSQKSYCADSTCLSDRHCKEGFTCRTLETESGKARVRLCSLVGVRKEGEGCSPLPSQPRDGCGPGLLCNGWCGRPCQLDDPASCPGGFFCAEGTDGPSCLPTCEGRSCPDGQRCLARDDKGVSFCTTVYGQDCEQTPCTQGQECITYDSARRPDLLWRECLQPCGKNHPPCPGGTVCHLLQCRRTCDPEAPDSCGPNFRCGRRHEEDPWTCVPG